MLTMNLIFCQPLRSSSKRSAVLLMSMSAMLMYILNYKITYPYDVSIDEHLWLSNTYQLSEGRTKCKGTDSVCAGCLFYNVSGFAQDLGYKCIKTATRPSTTVCVYDEWSDMYISHDLIYTGVWEPQVLKDFIEILSHNRHSGFIDLGANIGFYTLLAAKMGHRVIAVEPYRESIYRIHRALYLEHLGDMVYVLENAMSDTQEKATLRVSGNNQGDNQIKLKVRPCVGSCPSVIETITLDNLVSAIGNNFTSAIMKLDIQGFEHRAFQCAHYLFDTIDIRYILMEWFVMEGHYMDSNHTSPDKSMVEQMLTFLFSRHFRPYSLTQDRGKPLDPSLWYEWPFDIIWRRLPNTTEKTTILSNHFRTWPST